MIKMVCIDRQHAEIAKLQLIKLGRKAVLAGKAVIATGDYNHEIIRIELDAMAFTDTLTDLDREQL
tara:strand:- start:580 stop:777 length:198 start_codon:yes stop_codon:yes gene_type:complete